MNYEKNTIGWWLSRIADPVIRERALGNYDPSFALRVDRPMIVENISDAIFNAFSWAETPEQYSYWDNLRETLPALIDEPFEEPNYRQAIIELLEADKDSPFLPEIHRAGLKAIIRKGGAD